jgi:hypothetical protein
MRNQQKAKAATVGTTPTCSSSPASGVAMIKPGDSLTVSQQGFAAGQSIRLFGTAAQIELAKTLDSTTNGVSQSVTIPSTTPAGSYYILIVNLATGAPTNCAGSPFNVVFTFAGLTACDVDVNHDGKVNSIDLLAVSKHQPIYTSVYDATYDVNKDGKINSIDLLIVSKFQGQTCVMPTPSPSSAYLCTFSPSTISQGGQITVKSNGSTGPLVLHAATVSPVDISLNAILPLNGSVYATVPASTTPGLYSVLIAGADNNSYTLCFASPSTITTGLLTVTTPTPSSSPTPAYILFISNSTIANKGFCQNGIPYINLSWYAKVDTQFNIVKDGQVITSTTSSTWTSAPEVAGQVHTWRVDGITSGVTSDTLTITTPACTGV